MIFWFLNNGITIAYSDFNVDVNKLKIYNFSIVNGGQTTTLIGKINSKSDKDFFIMCKIIKVNSENVNNTQNKFFGKIAEAINS